MDQQFVIKMQERLDEERRRLEQAVERGAGGFGEQDADTAVAFPNIGDDDEENVQEVEVYDQNLAAARTFRDQLDEVVVALQRIENGTYGVCTKCGQEIDPARLEAFPSAVLCMTCAQQ